LARAQTAGPAVPLDSKNVGEKELPHAGRASSSVLSFASSPASGRLPAGSTIPSCSRELRSAVNRSLRSRMLTLDSDRYCER